GDVHAGHRERPRRPHPQADVAARLRQHPREHGADRAGAEDRHPPEIAHAGAAAVTSISTTSAGSTRPATITSVEAGFESPIAASRAVRYAAIWSVPVMNPLTRTMCSTPIPADSSTPFTFCQACSC